MQLERLGLQLFRQFAQFGRVAEGEYAAAGLFAPGQGVDPGDGIIIVAIVFFKSFNMWSRSLITIDFCLK